MTQEIQKGTLEHAALTDPKAAGWLEVRKASLTEEAKITFEQEMQSLSYTNCREMMTALPEIRTKIEELGGNLPNPKGHNTLQGIFDETVSEAMLAEIQALNGAKISAEGLSHYHGPGSAVLDMAAE